MSVELNQPDFKISFRGYDRAQVDELHQKALAAFEALQAENARLKEETTRLRDELEMHRREERFVQEALVTAQKTADEIRNAAQKHADLVVEEARQEGEAERALALQRVSEMNGEIDRLRQDRRRFIEDFRLLLERYQRELHMVVHTEPAEIGSV